MKDYNSKKTLLYSILIGTLIRLIFVPFTGHPWDMAVWFQRGEFIFNLGINPLYLWLFGSILIPIILIFYPLVNLSWWVNNTLVLNAVTKLPFIISDIIIALLIYKIVYLISNDNKKSVFLAAIWIFNPIVIFFSSIHGMFDTIAALFLLLAFYFIIKNRFIYSFLFLFLGISIKYFPIFLFPFFIIYSWTKTTKKTKIKIFILGIVVALISFGSFLLNIATFRSFIRGLIFHSTGLQSGIKPYSILKILFDFGVFKMIPEIISNNIFWIIYLPIFIFLIVHFIKNRYKIDNKNLLVYSGIILLMLIPFNLNSLPQFIIWSLPILIISVYLFYYRYKIFLNLIWILAILIIITNSNLFIYFLNINHLITMSFNWPLYNQNLATILGLFYGLSILTLCFILYKKSLHRFETKKMVISKYRFPSDFKTIIKNNFIIFLVVALFIIFVISNNVINKNDINGDYYNKERIYRSTFSYVAENNGNINLNDKMKNYTYNFYFEPHFLFKNNTWDSFNLYFCLDNLPFSDYENKKVFITLNGKGVYAYNLGEKYDGRFTVRKPFYLILPSKNKDYWCSIIKAPQEKITDNKPELGIQVEEGVEWNIKDARLQLDLK